MSKYKRIFVVVVDSLGIGEMADAAKYGDSGADTLGPVSYTHLSNIRCF